jgi:hypothetical protein
VRERDDHVAEQHLGVPQHLVDRVDGRGGHPLPLKPHEPLGGRAGREDSLEDRHQLLATLDALDVRVEPRVVAEVRPVDRAAEARPGLLREDGHDQMPVRGRESLIGHHRGVAGPDPFRHAAVRPEVLRDVRQARHLAIEEGEVEGGILPRPGAPEERLGHGERADVPPARSPIGRPMRTGGRPGAPVMLIPPPMARRARSKAGHSRYGPACPNAEMEQTMSRGLMPRSVSGAHPRRAMTPGREFSQTTSPTLHRSWNTPRPAAVSRSSATLFLFRLIDGTW